MVKLILGHKGAGKTKKLIELVNAAVENSSGNVVCIEKESALTYDITHRCRLTATDNYKVSGYDAYYGFLCGIFAGDHDITDVFADATLKIGGRDMDTLLTFFHRIAALSDDSNINFTFTLSCDESELPGELFTIAQKA